MMTHIRSTSINIPDGHPRIGCIRRVYLTSQTEDYLPDRYLSKMFQANVLWDISTRRNKNIHGQANAVDLQSPREFISRHDTGCTLGPRSPPSKGQELHKDTGQDIPVLEFESRRFLVRFNAPRCTLSPISQVGSWMG